MEEFFYGVYRDEKKEEYLAEYHERGKSKSEFSREKNIPTTTFRRWIDNENRSTYGMIDLNKLDKEQQELYEKYNPDNIFKKKEQNTVVEDKEVPNSLSMVEYKKTNFIKKN